MESSAHSSIGSLHTSWGRAFAPQPRGAERPSASPATSSGLSVEQERTRADTLSGDRKSPPPVNGRTVETGNIERINPAEDVQALHAVTIEDTRLNKVRAYLVVAQNGRDSHSIDFHV